MAYQDVTHLPAPATGFTVWGHAKVTASKTSGSLISILNPLRVPCIATYSAAIINTGSTAACTVDTGAGSATDQLQDNQMDGISVNAPANTVYDNIKDAGSNGTTRAYVGPNGYLTAYVASGNANGLDMNIGWDLRLLSGGSPVR